MNLGTESNRTASKTTTEQIKKRYRCKDGWIEERWLFVEGETKPTGYVDYFIPDGKQ